MRGRKNHGTTLGSLMLLISISLLLLFTAASSSVLHLNFSVTSEARQQARNLAESAVAQALARVLDQEDFGANRAGGRAVQVDVTNYPAGSLGYQSFNQGEAGANGTPYSTNNFATTTAVPGAGRAVPGSTVHLVGFGRVAGVTQTVEVLYYRPPFPKALCATGPINASGGLSVIGLADGVPYPGSINGIPVADRRPGSVQSNDPSNPAIHLGPNCSVSGDAAAVGQVVVDPGSLVGGNVLSGGTAQPTPLMNLPALLGQVTGVPGTQTVSGSVGSLTVDYYTGSAGPLTINGDLTLSNGVLWVQGDLSVTGCILGQGLILVSGNVNIGAGSALSASNLVALAAGGNINLTGQGRTGYYFQGMLYSSANLVARDITVLGSIVTAGPAGAGHMDLQNLNVVQTTTSVTQVFGLALQVVGKQRWLFFEGSGPKQTYISLTPNDNPVTHARTYTVHVVSPPRSVNQVFPNLTAAGVQQLAVAIRPHGFAFRHPGVPNVEAGCSAGDALLQQLSDIQANPTANTVQMVLNNLMTATERARVLLWRSY